MVYSKAVADALGAMGVDPKHKERKENQERPRIDHRVAVMLESMGILYAKEAVITEQSPLDSQNPDPAVQPRGQPIDTPPESNKPPVPQQKKAPAAPNIQLKTNNTPQAQSLEELADFNAKILQTMKPIDVVIQSMTTNDEEESTISANREALMAVYKPLFRKVDQLKQLLDGGN